MIAIDRRLTSYTLRSYPIDHEREVMAFAADEHNILQPPQRFSF
jgi:hypothetical protein